jgi:hypothetical protein
LERHQTLDGESRVLSFTKRRLEYEGMLSVRQAYQLKLLEHKRQGDRSQIAWIAGYQMKIVEIFPRTTFRAPFNYRSLLLIWTKGMDRCSESSVTKTDLIAEKGSTTRKNLTKTLSFDKEGGPSLRGTIFQL